MPWKFKRIGMVDYAYLYVKGVIRARFEYEVNSKVGIANGFFFKDADYVRTRGYVVPRGIEIEAFWAGYTTLYIAEGREGTILVDEGAKETLEMYHGGK